MVLDVLLFYWRFPSSFGEDFGQGFELESILGDLELLFTRYSP